MKSLQYPVRHSLLVLALGALTFALFCPIASAQLTPSAFARWDDPRFSPEKPYLEGTLTWSGSQGGISWEAGATSPQDNMPTDPRGAFKVAGTDASLVDNAGSAAGMDVSGTAWDMNRYFTEPGTLCGENDFFGSTPCVVDPPVYGQNIRVADEAALGATTFTSQPLPETVYVDITKGLQIELALKFDADEIDGGAWGDQPCRMFEHRGPTGPDAYGALQEAGVPAESPSGFLPDPRTSTAQFKTRWIEPGLELDLRAKTGDNERVIGASLTTDEASDFFDNEHRFDASRYAGLQGYKVCFFQMHLEEFILEKGTVLTLTLHHALQAYWYPIGLQGGHASHVRLWKYSPEEVLYRFPVLEPEEDDAEDATQNAFGAAGLGSVAAALGLLLTGIKGRRRLLVTSLVVLLGVVALSGCLGGSSNARTTDTGPSGLISNTFATDKFNLSTGDTGTVLGVVKDDLSIPIKEVHVTLTTGSDFDKTSKDGRFQFYNVTPGVHKLRFDKAGYKVFEGSIEVRSKLVSTPVITLYLIFDPDRDFRPHPHDNWNGREKFSLPAFELPTPTCLRSWTVCTANNDWAGNPYYNQFQLPIAATGDPNVIPPGTWNLDLKLEWDASTLAGIDKLGLLARTPYGEHYGATKLVNGALERQLKVTTGDLVFAPRASNQPFHIRTTWEMTDNGHASLSTWRFAWYVPVDQTPSGAELDATQQPGWAPGKIKATLTFERGGVLPLEPAHVDPWQGKDVLEYQGGWKPVKSYSDLGFPLPPSPSEAPAGCEDVVVPGVYGPFNCYRPEYQVWMASNFVKDAGWVEAVPHDAKWMEVTLTRNRMPEPDWFQMRLHYHPLKFGDTYFYADQELRNYFAVDATSTEQSEVTKYKFKIPAEHLDDIYTAGGSWGFQIRPVDEDALTNQWKDQQYYETVSINTDGKQLEYSLNVKVHRDAWTG